MYLILGYLLDLHSEFARSENYSISDSEVLNGPQSFWVILPIKKRAMPKG